MNLDFLTDEEYEAVKSGDLSSLPDDKYEQLKSMSAQQAPAKKEFKAPDPESVDADAYLASHGFTVKEAPLTASLDLNPAKALKAEVVGGIQGITNQSAPIAFGATAAAADILTSDKTFTEYNSLRRAYEDKAREKIDQIKADSPEAFMAGEVVGGTALAATVGGPMAISGAALGASREYFGNPNADMLDIAEEALYGAAPAALVPAGKVAGKALQYAGERLGLRQALGGMSSGIKSAMRQFSEEHGLSPRQVVTHLAEKKLANGIPLLRPGQSAETTLNNLDIAMAQVDDRIAATLRQVESNVDASVGTILGSRLMPEVDSIYYKALSKTADNTKSKMAEEAKNWAEVNFKDQSFTLSEFKEKINSLRDSATNMYQKQIVDKAESILDARMINLRNVPGMQSIESLASESKLYGTLKTQVAKNIDREGSVFSNLKDRLLGMTIASATGSVGAGLTAMAVKEMMQSDVAEGAIGASMRRIGAAVQRNPERWGKDIQNLTLAARGTYKDFDNEVAYLDSKVSLEGDPVKRTTQDLLQKKDKLLSIMYKFDSNAATALSDALDSHDYGAARVMLDTVSKDPRFSYVIEKGIGWDGQITNEADKAQLQNEIIYGDSSKNLKTSQKLEAIKTLKRGAVPQFGQEPVNTRTTRIINNVIKRDSSGKKEEQY